MKYCKNLMLAAAFTAACAITLATPAAAEVQTGGENWNVTFTSGKAMESNFAGGQTMDDVLYNLEPGDTATFTVGLQNAYSETTDWYMTNEVLKTLEQTETTIANGGAYTYRLDYIDQNNITYNLYDSDEVGGEQNYLGSTTSVTGKESREGLHEATESLEDYFFLDQFAPGEGGKVVLTVGLDGESQGNLYQDTFAQLQMNFAVELSTTTITRPTPTPTLAPGETPNPATPTPVPTTTPTDSEESPTPTPAPNQATATPAPQGSAPAPTPRVRYVYKTIPQTSDDSNPVLIAIVCGVSGLALLALGIYQLRRKKRNNDNH